ncbi:MAG: class II fructose-bisphosphate aldolase [Clostridia bacterium]|nr:class II fructose-bisphosphate aldolase [Clostridia bacterium]
MLVNLKELLEIAKKRNIAVGAFDAAGLECVEAVFAAAEELDVPFVLMFAQPHEPWIPLATIGPVMVEMAKKSSVPVCVMLDHGDDLDYLKQALELGFTAVMYDGSALPYDQNVENTRRAVAMAKAYGASVEAELGSMGRRESGAGDHSGDEDETKIYTDPSLAKAFVETTGIDALACSFGTTHGIFLKAPKLDFDVVRNVRREAGDIPIVMHGASGVSKEDLHRSIDAGVAKINYFTYMDKAGGAAAVEAIKAIPEGMPVFFTTLMCAAREAMKQDVMQAMKVFAKMD